MLLNWRTDDCSAREKIIGTIFDAGAIRKNDLQWILQMSEPRLKRELHKLRVKSTPPLIQWLPVSFSNYRDHVYTLTRSGVEKAHEMIGIESRITTTEMQIRHMLGLNEVLFRFLRKFGFDGVAWQSTREATETLLLLRVDGTETTESDLRTSVIRPDAILTLNDQWWWVEFDNNTETSLKLYKKYRMYIRNLEPLDESFHHVVWVTKNEKRRDSMKKIWDKLNEKKIQMRFFVEGNEVFE